MLPVLPVNRKNRRKLIKNGELKNQSRGRYKILKQEYNKMYNLAFDTLEEPEVETPTTPDETEEGPDVVGDPETV